MTHGAKNPGPQCSAGAGFPLSMPCVVAGTCSEHSTTPEGVQAGSLTITSRDIRKVLNALPVLKQEQLAALRKRGVPLDAICYPEVILGGEVIIEGPTTFALAPLQHLEAATDQALLFPSCNEAGRLDAIIAWMPSRRWLGSWLGTAWALGSETVFSPRLCDHQALPIWRSPLGWLRARRRGIVLIRPERARAYLEDAGCLVAEDANHRVDLRRRLQPPPLRILVQVGGLK